MPFWRNNSSFTLLQPDFIHIVMQSIFSLAGYEAYTAEHTTFRRGGRFRFPNGLLAPSSTAAPPFLPHPNPAELMPSSTGQLALDDWEKMHSPNFRPLLPVQTGFRVATSAARRVAGLPGTRSPVGGQSGLRCVGATRVSWSLTLPRISTGQFQSRE